MNKNNVKLVLKYGTYNTTLKFYSYKDDEDIIKDYSENEGVLKSLIDAGIISEPLYSVTTGFVEVAVCKLLIKS